MYYQFTSVSRLYQVFYKKNRMEISFITYVTNLGIFIGCILSLSDKFLLYNN